MIPERTEDPAEEMSELEAEKEEQVLEREPFETDLMDHDESPAGEEVDGVDDDAG